MEKKYPSAEDVRWKVKSKGDYEIKFELNGKKTEVEIDDDGTWEKTTTHLNLDELPTLVKATVLEHKKGAEISWLKVTVKHNEETCYKAYLNNGKSKIKLKIDEKGKIISSQEKK